MGNSRQSQAPLTTANLAAHAMASMTDRSQPSAMQRWLNETDDFPRRDQGVADWARIVAADRLTADNERILQECKQVEK